MMLVLLAKFAWALLSRLACRVCGSKNSSYSGVKMRALPMAPVCIMTRPKAENVDTICTKRQTVPVSNRIDQPPTGSSKKKKSMKEIKKE
jgi:hypothetical protein